jgi:hypothetical protein
MTIQMQGDDMHQKVDRACIGLLEPEEAVKWEQFVQMIHEGRPITISDERDGRGVESAGELAKRHADEVLERVQAAEAVRVLGGGEALLPGR